MGQDARGRSVLLRAIAADAERSAEPPAVAPDRRCDYKAMLSRFDDYEETFANRAEAAAAGPDTAAHLYVAGAAVAALAVAVGLLWVRGWRRT